MRQEKLKNELELEERIKNMTVSERAEYEQEKIVNVNEDARNVKEKVLSGLKDEDLGATP